MAKSLISDKERIPEAMLVLAHFPLIRWVVALVDGRQGQADNGVNPDRCRREGEREASIMASIHCINENGHGYVRGIPEAVHPGVQVTTHVSRDIELAVT